MAKQIYNVLFLGIEGTRENNLLSVLFKRSGHQLGEFWSIGYLIIFSNIQCGFT